MVTAPAALTPIAAADLRPTIADASFENHKLELGGVNPGNPTGLSEAAPSPLFTTPSVTNSSSDASANTSEWDYLWRNASRIPITAIPEPTAASLVIGSALLLGARRLRKPAK